MADTRSVILVGHCMPDKFMLKSAVKRLVPGADIVTVNDAGKLAEHASSQSVLLVNRVLDGQFDTRSGIELIETLAAADDPPVAILISNHEDAQAQAVAAGARPGFGKSDLYAGTTAEILRDAVGTA